MNKVVNGHDPDSPPEGLTPEDWPFEDEFPNVVSFEEILGKKIEPPPDEVNRKTVSGGEPDPTVDE